MVGLLLLLTVTTLYAGYNLLIKVSGSHVPEAATSTRRNDSPCMKRLISRFAARTGLTSSRSSR